MDFSFLGSPRFWFVGIGSVATLLVKPDFADLPWNQIVGQTLQLWMAGAAAIGLIDRTVDSFTQK